MTRDLSNPRWRLVWAVLPPPPANGLVSSEASGLVGPGVGGLGGTGTAPSFRRQSGQGAMSFQVAPPSVVESSLPSPLSAHPVALVAKLSATAPNGDATTLPPASPVSGTLATEILAALALVESISAESAMASGTI